MPFAYIFRKYVWPLLSCICHVTRFAALSIITSLVGCSSHMLCTVQHMAPPPHTSKVQFAMTLVSYGHAPQYGWYVIPRAPLDLLLIDLQWAELSNGFTHLTLRNLRPAGTRTRAIPYGYGFDLVSCPNYTFEIIGWIVLSIMTGSYAGEFRQFVVIAPRSYCGQHGFSYSLAPISCGCGQ